MARLATVAALLALTSCGGPPGEHRHTRPSCSHLRQSARHELGDTGGEIERHCRRD
jgi:hypothetical protein